MKIKAITTIMLTLFLASMLSMAFMVPVEATPDSGIVGLWHFDEGIGSTASDSSGCGNDGTLSGGKFGNALYFDGVDDYVNILDNSTLDLTGNITLEAWILIKSFSTSEGYHMYIIGKDSAGQRSYGIGVDLTWMYPKKPFVIIFHSGGSYKIAWGTNDLVIDHWYHIAGVFDATNDKLTLYVDGVSQPTVTDKSSINPGNADLRIGGREYAGHGCYFNGLIDEVRISDAVRYTSTFAPSNAPFSSDTSTVGLWHFDESTGSIAFDESDNHNDGTIYDASWAGPTWTPGLFGSALRFDGVDDYVSLGPNVFSDADLATYTFEAWINIYALDGVQRRIFDDEGGLRPMLTSGNKLQAFHWDSTAWTGKTVTWATTPMVDQWYHVAQTYNGTHMKFYVEGNLIGTCPADEWKPDGLNRGVNIASKWSLGNYWKGLIDEARIWNRALSDEEVKRHAWGLVGEWLFDEGSGTITHDSSGFGYDGTINGATYVLGKYGSALSFDPTDGIDSVSIGDVLDFMVGDSLTIETWVKTTTTSYVSAVIVKMPNNLPFTGYDLYILNGHIGFVLADQYPSTAIQVEGTTLVNDGVWRHLAVTYDGSGLASGVKLYVDGAIETMNIIYDTDPVTTENSQSLRFGSRADTGNTIPYKGFIDEVRIWNQVLTPVRFDQTGLDDSATGELVVVVEDPITLNYEDLPYVMMVESGTEVTYTYEQIVSSNIIGKSFSLDSVTGGASPSDTITITDPTTITGNYVTQYETSVDIDPNTLNLKSNGEWITAYIEFPSGYDVADIDVESIQLSCDTYTDGVDPDAPTAIGDYDNDGVPDLMVKFDRLDLIKHIKTEDFGDADGKFCSLPITITGMVTDLPLPIPFEGTDTIRVRI